MLRNLFFFLLGGAAVLAGKKYSRQISRELVRGAVQANRTVRRIAAEAMNEADQAEGQPGTVRRLEAVSGQPTRRATRPASS